MTEYRITLRPALAGKPAVIRNGVSIEALPEGALLHLLGNPSASAMPGPDADVALAGLSLRPVSPGQWFAVGETALPRTTLAALETAVKAKADIVDQSHGRVRILVRGPMAVKVLAKGTAVDLALSAFPVGQTATTLIGHIAAHLTRTGDDAFELIVLRGFAESLWDDLARMSLEFS